MIASAAPYLRRVGLVAGPRMGPRIAAPKDGAVVSEKINGDMCSVGFAGAASSAEGVFLDEMRREASLGQDPFSSRSIRSARASLKCAGLIHVCSIDA
jgi:hypothetical protein